MCHPEDGGNTSVRNYGISQYLQTVYYLPSAHNWLDAGVIETAVDKLNIAGDRLDLIRIKDLPVLFLRIWLF
jgi:hypothetical protein